MLTGPKSAKLILVENAGGMPIWGVGLNMCILHIWRVGTLRGVQVSLSEVIITHKMLGLE